MTLTTYPDSPFLRLRPWARDAVSPEDYLTLAERAETLGVRLGALGMSDGGFVCTATRFADGKRFRLRAHGPLAAILAGLLDDVETANVGWTPEELVTVAVQSGMEVRRA